jgi:hypothetical protein
LMTSCKKAEAMYLLYYIYQNNAMERMAVRF